jgi:CBS domain-containing protein
MSAEIGKARRALAEGRVEELMSSLIVTCEPDEPLREVARRLARHRVHCVLVPQGPAGGDRAPWGMVSDLDVVTATLAGADDVTAGEAALPAGIVPSDERVDVAARLMAERRSHHVIVVEPGTQRPVGILSALDLAGLIGRQG